MWLKQEIHRVIIAASVPLLLVSCAHATQWSPRHDVGVAAVDARTGKVQWEAWRLDELPAGTSKEVKAAVEHLLAMVDDSSKADPHFVRLPDVDVKDLDIKNPWPPGWDVPGPFATLGRSLFYYRHAHGIIAFDRETKKERWRLLTSRYPYPSMVLEAGDNLSLVQIGSDVPSTLRAALMGESKLGLQKLEPHTFPQRVASAMLLHHYGDGYLRPEIQKIMDLLRKEKTEPAIATKDLEKLLADWPRKRDHQRLLDGCVTALSDAADSNPLRGFAWPATPRMLLWCLLQELIYSDTRDASSGQGYNYSYDGWTERPVSLSDQTKERLAGHCRKVIEDGPDSEKPFAASVLVSTAVGWSSLTDVERKKLFFSKHPSVWRWTAMALAKNGRRKELIEWASERPEKDHLDVVWVLQHKKPKEWPEQELKFWMAVARRTPGSIAYVLRLWDGPTPPALRETIRTYLKREIEKPTVKTGGSQPAYDLQAALYLLGGWNDTQDTKLLLKYLDHPAHHTVTRVEGGRQWEVRVYGLRTHVRALLEKRGVKVPPGVEYEKALEPGDE